MSPTGIEFGKIATGPVASSVSRALAALVARSVLSKGGNGYKFNNPFFAAGLRDWSSPAGA
jgi:hypothetical protein